jgi:peptide/nickel transport system substrate-binding protein
MTSADVKYSFERIIDPDVPAVAKGYFEQLASIETPDDATVKLVYREVFAPLLIALTRLETAIVPQEEVETEAWETRPIGSGPFRFESYVPDQAAILVRNDDYWEEGLPLLARVEQRIIPENETAVINLQTADIHVTEVEAKDRDALSAAAGVTVEQLPSTFWPHLSVNTSRPPFDDVKVRQAIRLGFNRDDIKQLVFFGTGTISNTLLPVGNPFRSEVDGWAFDPEAARALLAEAGYADGFSTTLRITASNAWQLAAAQIVQAYLQDLNIQIEIEQIEATTWFSEVFSNSEFEMTMVAHVSKVDPDLSMLDILHSGELGTKNYTQFNDPEMDQLLEQGRATVDPDERKRIYAEAQQIFVERSGYIVLNLQDLAWGVRDEVQNFTVLPTGELRWKETSLSS